MHCVSYRQPGIRQQFRLFHFFLQNLSAEFLKNHAGPSPPSGPNAVENRDYLSMMCSPDFNQQMSVNCDSGAPITASSTLDPLSLAAAGGGTGSGGEEQVITMPRESVQFLSNLGNACAGGGGGVPRPLF